MVTFSVTTRSRLRSVLLFFPMLGASLRIRKQLAEAPGCIRFASIIMGPREFWTITVWETRQTMIDFMRSGAHEDIMWDFKDWLKSFWLMRWSPTGEELGTWTGMHLGQKLALPAPPPERTEQQQEALKAAMDVLPRLKAAAAPSGKASFDYSPAQRRARRLVAGGIGATLRLEVPARQTLSAWWAVRRLRAKLLQDTNVLRAAFGISKPRELYSLIVFRHEEAWREFQNSPMLARMRERWGDGLWTMRWEAENEFGHWDGLRLRRVKLGTAVEVPKGYEKAIAVESDAEKAAG
ncbi:MAG: antibiotic biosynthesis monooxygenase [Actinomycetota bacterium]